jgi:D-glycero-D-manno-heptose 1,7-bisphosphate phosphatase
LQRPARARLAGQCDTPTVPGSRLRGIKTVFLDRDGTLNVKAPEGKYITSPADLVLLPRAAQAVARLNAVGLHTILVTNQRWLSGPMADPRSYAAVEARLQELLAAEGAWLDASFHCPHETGRCDCHKPGSGMLLRAASELRLDLASAVIVGDSEADMAAGRSVGTAGILIRDGSPDATGHTADAVVADLAAAVRLILAARG